MQNKLFLFCIFIQKYQSLNSISLTQEKYAFLSYSDMKKITFVLLFQNRNDKSNKLNQTFSIQKSNSYYTAISCRYSAYWEAHTIKYVWLHNLLSVFLSQIQHLTVYSKHWQNKILETTPSDSVVSAGKGRLEIKFKDTIK